MLDRRLLSNMEGSMLDGQLLNRCLYALWKIAKGKLAI